MIGEPPVGFWEQADAWQEEYADWARLEPRRPRGIWFSELFAFLTFCRLLRVDAIIESGIHFGQSSAAIQRWHAGRHLGIDRAVIPMQPKSTMAVFCGDAMSLLLPLIRHCRDGYGGRVAVLLDGPKDVAAVDLAEEALAAGASLVGIHDMYVPLGGVRVPRRRLIELGESWFTDEPVFVRRCILLDGPVGEPEDPRAEWLDEAGNGKLPYCLVAGRRRFRQMQSYGPTLGFVWQPGDWAPGCLPEPPGARRRTLLGEQAGNIRVLRDGSSAQTSRGPYLFDSCEELQL